jgi:hypothetical protein
LLGRLGLIGLAAAGVFLTYWYFWNIDEVKNPSAQRGLVILKNATVNAGIINPERELGKLFHMYDDDKSALKNYLLKEFQLNPKQTSDVLAYIEFANKTGIADLQSINPVKLTTDFQPSSARDRKEAIN